MKTYSALLLCLLAVLLFVEPLFPYLSPVQAAPVPVYSAASPPSLTSRVSVGMNGAQPNSGSGFADITADGRYIAFSSFATNLVQVDTNGRQDVFVYDRQTRQNTLVSVSSAGTQSAQYEAGSPSISANGRWVAFVSGERTFLAPGITNVGPNIFVRDLLTGETTAVSVAHDGTTESPRESFAPAISGDGRYVAFASNASNLVANDTNNSYDIFVHDRETGVATRVSVTTGGAQANGNSWEPAISADGRFVAFSSDATNLAGDDTNGVLDIFVYDRQTGTTTRVSIASDGTQAENRSADPSLSADGRYIAFVSQANNLVENDVCHGSGSCEDVFVHDRQTGQTGLASKASDGSKSAYPSWNGEISADGYRVVFESSAWDLVDGDTNGVPDIFVHDLRDQTTTRVSVKGDCSEVQDATAIENPSISADGSWIAFEATDSSLVPNDTNGVRDIFLHQNACAQSPPPPPPGFVLQHRSYQSSAAPKSQDKYKLLSSGGDPVDLIFGNFTYAHTDLALPGVGLPVHMTRSYNSALPRNGILGWGWNLSFDLRVDATNAPAVRVTRGDGRTDFYTLEQNGTLTPASNSEERLVKNGDGSYTLTTRDFTVYQFNSAGQLQSAQDPYSNSVALSYTNGRWSGITDAAGRSWNLAYDAGGRVTTITDPAGRTVQYTYDGAGNLISVTNPAGGKTTYAYDADHRLTRITDANGNLYLENEYSQEGRVTTQTDGRGIHRFVYNTAHTLYIDPTGASTRVDYDTEYRMVRRTDAGGGVRIFTFGPDGLVAEETDPRGGVTKYEYDSRGNITRRTDALGHVWNYQYDARDNLTAATDPLGRTTTATYDAGNRPLSITNPLNQTTNFSYDGRGLLAQQSDPLGNSTAFAYSSTGYLTKQTDALGYSSTYTYDTAGRLVSQADGLARTTSYTYNPLDLLLSVTGADGSATAYAYDAVGNRTGITDPRGHRWQYEYTGANDLAVSRDPLGNATHYGYDGLGRMITQTLPGGGSWTTTYDSLGQIVARRSPLGHLTRYGYDAAGNLLNATDALGQVTSYAYDLNNRLISVIDALGGVTQYAYDAVGNLTAATDARGNTTSYAYDALNRLVQETDALGHTRTLTYDALSRIAGTTNGAGETIGYSYDAVGNLLSATAGGESFSYQYDAAGNLIGMSDGLGTSTFTYDGMDRLLGVHSPQGALGYAYDPAGNRTGLTQPGLNSSYVYDALNRLTEVHANGALQAGYSYDSWSRVTGEVLANGVSTNWGYDADSRLLEIVVNGPGGTLHHTTYTVDALGNRVTEESSDSSATYQYDALSRLTEATVSVASVENKLHLPMIVGSQGAVGNALQVDSVPVPQTAASPGRQWYTFNYTYDAVGNRLTKTENDVTTTYSYDAANRILAVNSVPFTYDAAGRLVNDGSHVYQYNAYNRLTAISGAINAGFQYDGMLNRVGEVVNGAAHQHLLDITGRLPQRLASTSNGNTTHFLYGLDRIAHLTPTGPRFEHNDGLGNTRFLTESDGAAGAKSHYKPFGQPLQFQPPYGFSGEPQSTETGLVHLRARDYSPSLGRFLTPDPVAPLPTLPQTLNLYQYAYNNPANLVDPSGEFIGEFINWIGSLFSGSSQEKPKAKVVSKTKPKQTPAPRPPAPAPQPKIPSIPPITSRPPAVVPNPNPGSQLVFGNKGLGESSAGKLIGNNGNTLIGNNGNTLIGADGSTLIGADGSTLIGADGSTLIGAGGASLISDKGVGLIGMDGASLIGNDAGSLIGNDAGSLIGNNGNTFRRGGY